MDQANVSRISSKRAEQTVYVPPGRRSNGGSQGAISDAKQNTRQTSEVVRRVPPSCCEPDDSEEQTLPKTNPPAGSTASAEQSPKNLNAVTSEFQEKTALKKRMSSNEKRRNDSVEFVTERRVLSRKSNQAGEGSRESSAVSPNEIVRPYFVRPPQKKNEPEMSVERFHTNEVCYIDSHCHTDFIFSMMPKRNYHDGLQNWLDGYPKASNKGFAGCIVNFIDPALFVDEKNNRDFDMEWIQEELKCPFYLGTTWGCHPHQAQKWGTSQGFWDALNNVLAPPNSHFLKVRAIGECGIDLHRCISDLEIQKEVFEKHIELAFKYDLPLVIHCRNGSKGQSENICLEILAKQMNKPGNHRYLKIHRHCYTEDWVTAKKWLKQCPDVHFGFTPGILLFKEHQLNAVRNIPLDRILLETDAPYFKPKVFEGIAPPKTTLPPMAIAAAYKIAELKGLSPEEVLRATYNNTRRMYRLEFDD
ncbi:unnamed protein product [Caenorhabditis sp. 36 PRJEB53466]|nr:unnamed protein product [Caenorhabditis sp. 36 PRJEB53466]